MGERPNFRNPYNRSKVFIEYDLKLLYLWGEAKHQQLVLQIVKNQALLESNLVRELSIRERYDICVTG
jgi:hypothetical protein